jgi:hypothetical protein
MQKYLEAIRRLESSFEGFTVKKIQRVENEETDALAKAASQGTPLPPEVFFEVLRAPSVELQERVVLSISPVSSEDWRSEIIAYLCDEHHSDDEAWSTRMTQRTRQYKWSAENYTKRGSLLRC